MSWGYRFWTKIEVGTKVGCEILTISQVMLILLVCGVHLKKKRRPQYPWAQGLSPPCTKGSPRELLKRVSVWVSPLRDSYSTWAGLWSYCFKSSPDDSTGKSGLKTTTMLCTVFFKPDLKSSAQSPEPPADVTQPYSLNHLARPSQLFFLPGLSELWSLPEARLLSHRL